MCEGFRAIVWCHMVVELGVILAAGIGSRLRPYTDIRPKCMMRVAGKAIIAWQLEAFRKAGVVNVIIVAGYLHELVEKLVEEITDMNITVLINHDFNTTNNMYSLYMTKDYARGKDFVLLNGDVVLHGNIMENLVNQKESDFICVDVGKYVEESMKVVLDESAGILVDISKKISPEDSYGNSIDLYRFSHSSSNLLFEECHRVIVVNKNLKDWSEVALQTLLQTRAMRMRPLGIDGLPWVEIDNTDDLLDAELRFGGLSLKQFREKQLYLIDMDGTLFLGDEPIEGASSFVKRLRTYGGKFRLITNNSSSSKKKYAARLCEMQIDVSDKDITVSTDGLIAFLKDRNIKNIYVVGTESMKESLYQAGIHCIRDTELEEGLAKPSYVVVGNDTELTFKKLCAASKFINSGIPYICTHCDVTCPTRDGPVPDVGSITKMLSMTTGVEPLVVFGKPKSEFVEHMMQEWNLSPEEVVVVGDRLYTDQTLARNLGCAFVLVLSGETDIAMLQQAKNIPDLVVPSVGSL